MICPQEAWNLARKTNIFFLISSFSSLLSLWFHLVIALNMFSMQANIWMMFLSDLYYEQDLHTPVGLTRLVRCLHRGLRGLSQEMCPNQSWPFGQFSSSCLTSSPTSTNCSRQSESWGGGGRMLWQRDKQDVGNEPERPHTSCNALLPVSWVLIILSFNLCFGR